MESMEFTIGAEATCTDGVCGEVIRVVVDPVAKAVTHVVVEPKHRSGLGKLVPLDLVESTKAGGLQLRCSTADLHALESAETTQFLPGRRGVSGLWRGGRAGLALLRGQRLRAGHLRHPAGGRGRRPPR